MNPFPISLPFSFPEGASVRVYVYPDVKYGEYSGNKLIELYGISNHRFRDNKLHECLHWIQEDNLLFFGNITKGKTELILKLSKPIDDAMIITIFFPHSQLPESIQIGKHHYKLRDVIHCMEDVLIEKFIYRYEPRIIKTKINTSIEVTLQPMEKGLIIFGKKGYSYFLRRE